MFTYFLSSRKKQRPSLETLFTGLVSVSTRHCFSGTQGPGLDSGVRQPVDSIQCCLACPGVAMNTCHLRNDHMNDVTLVNLWPARRVYVQIVWAVASGIRQDWVLQLLNRKRNRFLRHWMLFVCHTTLLLRMARNKNWITWSSVKLDNLLWPSWPAPLSVWEPQFLPLSQFQPARNRNLDTFTWQWH